MRRLATKTIRNPTPKCIFTPPLFDRLCVTGTSYLDEEGVMASVETELSHLLNTRMTTLVPPEDREDSEEPEHLIPECFGLEDFTSDETDEELLANRIRESVIHFEPRLENPIVVVKGTRNNIRKALVTISGDLVLGSKRVRVTFPLVKHMD